MSGGLELLKIETRLRDERFESVKGECVLREYVTLHTPYPLHLTTVRTYTLESSYGVARRSHDPGIIANLDYKR